MAVAFRRADEIEFGPIKSDFFAADQLRVVKRRRRRTESQTVGLSDVVDVIGGDHAARARHVLHQNRRVTGNMFAHVTRVGSGKKIMGVAGQVADDDADRFALIKIRLRECLFKVQGVQEFKDEEDKEPGYLERWSL